MAESIDFFGEPPAPIVPADVVLPEPTQAPVMAAPVNADYFRPEGLGESIDKALDEIFARYGMARLGGASGRGWSSRAVLQKCPYLFYRSYVLPTERVGTPLALTTGSAFHAFMAVGYQNLITPTPLTSEKLRDELLTAGVTAAGINEAWRLYYAYTVRYEVDYLRPLAVEHLAGDDEGNTCRYDLIAEVVNHPAGLPDGVYNVEHKTASRFDQGTLDGWFNDGEILGQMRIWPRARLARKFGKLQGVIVNLVSKTKIPQFERIVVPVQTWQIKQHDADLKALDMLQTIYKTTNTWPRFRNSCVGRYGKCAMFDHCANPAQK